MILAGTIKYKLFANVAIISVCLKVDSSFADLNFEGFVSLQNTPQEEFGSIDISIDNKLSSLWEQKANVTEVTWPVWTIEPYSETTGVIISSVPADLVKASVDEGVLVFDFNSVAFEGHEEAGVRIQVPPGNIESISVGDRQNVQIMDGFTNLQSIGASAFSRLLATLNSSQNKTIMTRASYNSEILLETENTYVDVSGFSTVKVKGSVVGGNLEKASTLYVQGPVNQLDVSGGSSAFVNDESGCENVKLQIDILDKCTTSSIPVNVAILNATKYGPSSSSFSHTNNRKLMAVSIIGSVIGFLIT